MLYKFLIIVVAAWLLFSRLVGVDWDQGQHLHPDERFMTMVADVTKWPSSLAQYFDTAKSPLNPHNVGHPYYVYGTLPMFLVKAMAENLGLGTYDTLPAVGRAMSAMVDIGIAGLVGYLAWILYRQKNISLLAAGLYSLMTLPIQLAHFYAVDPYLVFFSLLVICLVLQFEKVHRKRSLIIISLLAGICMGAAIASKVSALIILPMLVIFGLVLLVKTRFRKSYILAGAVFLITAVISVRIFQPYLFAGPSFFNFIPNPKVLANWEELDRLYSPATYGKTGPVFFPPATLFLSPKPYWFPLENLILWGLGLPLGLVTLGALVGRFIGVVKDWRGRMFHSEQIILFGIVTIFIAQASQFAIYMRYFYILYPLLAVIVARFVWDLLGRRKLFLALTMALFLIWPLAFTSIYLSDHSRVEASKWIYQHIPPGSKVTSEHWDDPLPLNLETGNSSIYQFLELPMYTPDTQEKWQEIEDKLSQVDYIIISSNRQYGSLTGIPDRYPATFAFYKDLFGGKRNFVKVAEFTSRPHIFIPGVNICLFPPWLTYGRIAKSTHECRLEGLSFVDDYADESFTVYDHPKITIFKRI